MTEFIKAVQEIISIRNSSDFYGGAESFIDKLKGQTVVLYGAGPMGSIVANSLEDYGIQPKCFCDTYKSGKHEESGLIIISKEQLKHDYPDATVIITTERHSKEIVEILHKLCYKGKIVSNYDDIGYLLCSLYSDFEPHIKGYEWAYNHAADLASKQVVLDLVRSHILGITMVPSSHSQYFDLDICPLTDKEIFVDGGCYNGDTSEEFIRQTGGKYTHIYGFEPEENLFNDAVKTLSKHKNSDVFKSGLWDSCGQYKYSQSDFYAGSGFVSENGDITIDTVTLDSFFMDKLSPTFIKMDIEGAELSALKGTSKILAKNKPKLAICVYHKMEDLYMLPQYIISVNPEYKIFFRHYAVTSAETVCYCV